MNERSGEWELTENKTNKTVIPARPPQAGTLARAYSGEVGHRFRWMWAGVRRASRWGKGMMPEVAHMGQAKSGVTSSSRLSRLHHFVSVISVG